MRTTILCALAFAGGLACQVLVADRGLAPGKPASQPIELAGKGFLGDSFQVGKAGEAWMIDTIRVWAVPKTEAASCPRGITYNLGDRLEKITLLGALENQPVAGQPECDCHALVTVATANLQKGSSDSANRDVQIAPLNGRAKGSWQIDFQNVRWSIPGGLEVLFSLRATDRRKADCKLAGEWSLAAAPGNDGDRLRRFNLKGVPEGFAEAAPEPVRISVQVWAHRAD